MKKLAKKINPESETLEAYGGPCACNCFCNCTYNNSNAEGYAEDYTRGLSGNEKIAFAIPPHW